MNTTHKQITGILAVTFGLMALTLFLAACTPTENANLTAGNGETATRPEAGATDSDTTDSDTADSAQVEEEFTGVYYTLPEGWYQKSTTDDPFKSAYRDETDPDFQYAPYSKISFAKPLKGTAQDALTSICPQENVQGGECEYVSDDNYEIKQDDVEGYTVYIVSLKGIQGGENLWQNTVAFEKKGVVYKVTFTGYKLDAYQPELELIVKTIEATADSETGEEKNLTFSYELPEGWRWMEEGKLDAILDEKSKNGVAPYVKLSPTGFPEGTEAETKQYIREIYDKAMEGCNYMLEQGESCDPEPVYKELEIEGTTVYVAMDTSEYWGDDTWASSFAFEKNGRSIRFILYDQADQYPDELKTIVNSFTWE